MPSDAVVAPDAVECSLQFMLARYVTELQRSTHILTDLNHLLPRDGVPGKGTAGCETQQTVEVATTFVFRSF